MKKEILEYSYKHNLAHIPSALSMVTYLEKMFTLVKKDDIIVIGKPFGSQAYYLVWQNLGWLQEIDNLHMGVKHDEIEFVDYSEETIGNALGVASGIALVSDTKVYVNLSDASLQMGNTLEAIQFIGHHQQNILVTIDANGSQVTGDTKKIIDIEPVYKMFKDYGWKVIDVSEHDKHLGLKLKFAYDEIKPTVVIVRTKKGSGIKSMEKDIKKWHYKKIDSQEELQSLVQELPAT